MAKWYNLPAEPLQYHPYQDAFWKARRERLCKSCKIEFDSNTHPACPQCNKPGVRKYHRFCLLSGRRGGKTRAGAIAAVEEACVPNSIGWACAPTAPKLHRYILPALRQLIPSDWVQDFNLEFLDIRLVNGSQIHLQTLEDPDQGRGQGLDWVWLDEACELTRQHWDVLRPSLTERRGAAFFTSSPRGFDWVWEDFYHRAEEGFPGYWACKYATSANPIIQAEELAEAKATMSDSMYRQEYEADFVIFTGAVYGGLIDPQIIRTPDALRDLIPEWPSLSPTRSILVGLDSGANHPFGAVKLVVTEKGIVAIGEYLQRDKSFIQHASTIKALASSSLTEYAIDKNNSQGILELAQHGIYCQPSENDVVAGIERVKSWLYTKQLYFYEPLTPCLIKQMKSLRWAESKTKDGQYAKEKVYKKEDELPDCTRYALLSYPRLPDIPSLTPLRDISNFPPETQQAIHRMRRIEERSTPDVVSDFW